MKIFHTIDVMLSIQTGAGQGQERFFHEFSLFCEFELFL